MSSKRIKGPARPAGKASPKQRIKQYVDSIPTREKLLFEDLIRKFEPGGDVLDLMFEIMGTLYDAKVLSDFLHYFAKGRGEPTTAEYARVLGLEIDGVLERTAERMEAIERTVQAATAHAQ